MAGRLALLGAPLGLMLAVLCLFVVCRPKLLVLRPALLPVC